MAKTSLSDIGIRALPLPEKGQRNYWDEKLPSFGVRVSQAGSKTFILNSDNTFITIGKFGVLSLAAARAEAKRLLAEKTLGKLRPQSTSFANALEDFLEEKARRRRPSTVRDHKRHLSLLGFKGPLTAITHRDLERKLKKLPPSEFNHRLSCAKTFFTWAQKKRYITDNPTVGLSPYGHTSRTRVLSDQEIHAIWKAADGTFGTIVKLLILTSMRRGECAALHTSWIDLENKTLTIPAMVTKNGREHVIPLGNIAMDILSPLPDKPSLLFPARGTSSPFNGWSKSKAALDSLTGMTGWTLHDIRRSVATKLAEMGVQPHVIERLLNHVSGQISGVAAIYNRATYIAEMRDAIDKWEARLAVILQ